MSISIRLADAQDIPWLCAQLRQFATFVGTKRSLFPTEEKCVAVLKMLIAQHPLFVAEKAGDDDTPERVGFIGGTLAPHPMNEDITLLSEMFWWVDPLHRGGRAGYELLRAWSAFGRAHADQVVMTLEHHSPVKPSTLEHFGFHVVEHTYLLEV